MAQRRESNAHDPYRAIIGTLRGSLGGDPRDRQIERVRRALARARVGAAGRVVESASREPKARRAARPGALSASLRGDPRRSPRLS